MTTNSHEQDVPALAVEGITKTFGPNKVLFGIDFEVQAGEVHALLGENGAGKSTLVKILSGYLQPTDGRISVAGRQVELEDSGQGEDLGIVLIPRRHLGAGAPGQQEDQHSTGNAAQSSLEVHLVRSHL